MGSVSGIIFRKRTFLRDALVGSRFRRVKSLKQRCGFLNTGAQWHMLPQCYPNYKTVHGRFQTWCQSEVLRRILTDIGNELRGRGVLDEEESSIDATFAMAKGGGAGVGPTKRGKGLKMMAIVDCHGLPRSVSTHAGNHHEVRLVQLCFDFYMIEAKPENLIGDRAYDNDPLDAELRRDGIEMIAPHRSNRSKPATQDGRQLRRYARRWVVERFFAWIQWQRRILIRQGVLPTKLPRLRPTRLLGNPLQAILR
jgi:transposase